MKLVHLTEMTPPQWYDAWNTMFDPSLGDYMGVDPELIAAKPTLEGFYKNLLDAHAAGRFQGWGIIKDGVYKGHVTLDKQVGEWECGVVLADPADWNRGMAIRASLHACKWAFEEDGAEWVVAFTQGKDPTIVDILHRGGFRPFINFHVMDKPTWDARWRARSK